MRISSWIQLIQQNRGDFQLIPSVVMMVMLLAPVVLLGGLLILIVVTPPVTILEDSLVTATFTGNPSNLSPHSVWIVSLMIHERMMIMVSIVYIQLVKSL